MGMIGQGGVSTNSRTLSTYLEIVHPPPTPISQLVELDPYDVRYLKLDHLDIVKVN